MSSTCNSGSPGREAARSTGLFLDKKWKDEKKHNCAHYILYFEMQRWIDGLPGCQTFVCVVNAKAAPEVDDLDVHEVLMVSSQNLKQKHGQVIFSPSWPGTCLMWRWSVEKTVTSMMVLPRWTWTPTITTLCSVCTIQLGIIRPYDDKTTVWTRRFPTPGTSFQDCQHFWEIGLADLVIGFYCRSLRKTINGQ